MKKTQLILLLIIIKLLLVSCNHYENEHKTISMGDIEKKLNFEIDKKKSIKNFDSIFQKLKVIKLETKEASLITNISKIDYLNNNIYVIDFSMDYSVTCFDNEGKFKFKLKRIGRGPHEYINFIYGSINDYTGDIELIANSGRDFIVYDSLGNFKQKQQLPYSAKSFCSLKNRRYFYKGYIEQIKGEKNNFRVYSTNNLGLDVKKYLPYKVSDNPDAGSHYINGFSKVKYGEYRFCEKFNDTIYKVNSNGFSPLYKINFLGYENNKPNDFLYNSKEFGDQVENAKKLNIPSIRAFHEFDNYITGRYARNMDKGEYS